MSIVGALPPVARLVVTLFMCLVPTLAFFGLLRGLERIRDDDLINEWAAGADEDVGEVDLAAVLAGESSPGSDDGSEARSRSPVRSGGGRHGGGGGDAHLEQSGDSAASDAATGDATADGTVRCRHCGAPNPEGVTFCAECVERL